MKKSAKSDKPITVRPWEKIHSYTFLIGVEIVATSIKGNLVRFIKKCIHMSLNSVIPVLVTDPTIQICKDSTEE